MKNRSHYIFKSLLIASFLAVLGVFGLFNNADATTGYWAASAGSDTPAASYKVYYDESDLLTFKVHFDNSATYSYGFTPDHLLFRYGQLGGTHNMLQLNLKIDGTQRTFLGLDCDSSHVVSSTAYFGSSQAWCKVDNSTNQDLIIHPTAMRSNYSWSNDIYNATGITKSDIDNYYGMTDYLENDGAIVYGEAALICDSTESNCISSIGEYFYPSATTFPYTVSSIINGVCGSGEGETLTTIPPSGTEACSSGTITDFSDYSPDNGETVYWGWICSGSGGGYSSSCLSAPVEDEIDGECGSDNGETLSEAPTEFCSFGYLITPTFVQTLTGWTWSCGGYNGGSTASCSATNSGSGTTPTIPSETDCSGYSGVEYFTCKIGNILQNMFLPSTEKVEELQTAVNQVKNRFPFNYIQAIADAFSTNTITEGGISITLGNRTMTLDGSMFTGDFFVDFRYFTGFMLLLAFLFWAREYIKHFFK